MPNARRFGLFLLVLASAPLVMAAGGGPDCAPFLRTRAFTDVDGNGIQEAGEPERVTEVRVYGTKLQVVPAPRVRAPITVDRHTPRQPGGEGAICTQLFSPRRPGCTTAGGGNVSIALTQGSRRAQGTHNVLGIPFQLGCLPKLTPTQELEGGFVSDGIVYTPIADYWLPLDQSETVSLFAEVGVPL